MVFVYAVSRGVVVIPERGNIIGGISKAYFVFPELAFADNPAVHIKTASGFFESK